MIITNHVWTGAVIGAVAPGPVSAFAAGVASHFVLDRVPHWGDDSIFLEVAVPDGLVGLAALGALARTARRDRRASVLAGMLGACLPDADKPSNLFFGRSPFPAALDEWHVSIQREHTDRLPQELVAATVGLLAARWVLGHDRPRRRVR